MIINNMRLRLALLVLLAAVAAFAITAYAVWLPLRLPSVVRHEISMPNQAKAPATKPTPEPRPAAAPEKDPMADWSTYTRQAFALLPEIPGAKTLALELNPRRHVFQVGTEIENGGADTSIWFVADGVKRLLTTGTVDVCSGYTIATTSNGFLVDRMDSPCEAMATSQVEYYSPEGKKLGSLNHSTPEYSFNVAWGGRDHLVALVYRGSACNDLMEKGVFSAADIEATKIDFIGVKVDGRSYTLPKPKSLSCEPAYGDAVVDPTYGRIEYLGQGRFAVDVGFQEASFTLDLLGKKTVIFGE